MLSNRTTAACAAICLLASTFIAAAQQLEQRADAAARQGVFVARVPDQVDVHPAAPAPAPNIRALLADPAVKNFIGLSENAWDFTDPSSVPGFGPLPQDGVK